MKVRTLDEVQADVTALSEGGHVKRLQGMSECTHRTNPLFLDLEDGKCTWCDAVIGNPRIRMRRETVEAELKRTRIHYAAALARIAELEDQLAEYE